jgi:hypothetical protein
VDGAERDPELAELHGAHSAARRAPLRAVLERAVAAGDLPAGTDLDLAVDLLAGPLFYRRQVLRGAVAPADVPAIVRAVLPGLLAGPAQPPAQDGAGGGGRGAHSG